MSIPVAGVRKFPFICAFFLLLLFFAAFLLLFDSQIPFPVITNISHSTDFSIHSNASDHNALPDRLSDTASIATQTSFHDQNFSDSTNSNSNSNFSIVTTVTFPPSPKPSIPAENSLHASSVSPETKDPSPQIVPVPVAPTQITVPITPSVSNESAGIAASPSDVSAVRNVSGYSNVGLAAPVGFDDDNDTQVADMEWKLCKGPVAVDYIPCLDNWSAIKRLRSRRHMEHRERHCPNSSLRCLVPLPNGYRVPVPWPKSRDMIWYTNVPHPKLVEYKKDQRWVAKRGEYFYFPGGGTQFRNGVNFYLNSIEQTLPQVEWGKRTRVILDVGCGVASFGGKLLDKNVITMSIAPKDEHEAQIQFALERGIPATLGVIGTQRLPFPDKSFELIHCARCRVHWDGDGGKPLMELNRLLRPGGYFVWSATPVYKKDEKHQNVWKSMVALSESLCWTTVAKTFFPTSYIGIAIYQKPVSTSCYQSRKVKKPPLCDQPSKLNSSWYTPLDGCIVPIRNGSNQWPLPWPERLTDKPLSLPNEQGVIENFQQDTRHWSALISEVYLGALGINWTSLRNVMDMNAHYGGFAAALINLPLWVMNVVPIHEADTLPVIYDRGLIGMYHDWCESFNTYPRTYDLLHASFLLGNLTNRCELKDVAVEMDRMVRPNGYVVVQDNVENLRMLKPVLKSLHWSTKIHQNQFLVGKKSFWRPVPTT